MRSDTSQIILIVSGVLVTALFGAFFYRELFPEYKIYQEDYVALETFRSTYTNQAIPPFKFGVKQIVLEREDKGPAVVDRCTSCHVALQIPYFSPTKIAKDLNGNLVRDEKGNPVLVPNEEYIWLKLDEKIAELKDEKVLAQLKQEGRDSEVQQRLTEANRYENLKIAHVNQQTYDVTKVLSMHPLMGAETRPFEFHPIEEYGCTVCHNGNGKGLVTDKAHGPVYDGQYEGEFRGPIPEFNEKDPLNDPPFAKVFNDKPGHDLLFQTEPLFVGSLIQAKCIQCHQTSDKQLLGAITSTENLAQKKEKRLNNLVDAYNKERISLQDLLALKIAVQQHGYEKVIQELQQKKFDYTLPKTFLENSDHQLKFIHQAAQQQTIENLKEQRVLNEIDHQLLAVLGSKELIKGAQEAYQKGSKELDEFLKVHQKDPNARGSLFLKAEALDFNQDLMEHIKDTQYSFESAVADQKTLSALTSEVDELTRNYQRGKELFLSQACFACHRIAGFTRGGIGPELTKIGDSYPWYIKESIVWPQADLHSSTMPNFRLDHEELEDLMTFLLAQKGGSKAVAQTSYQRDLQTWESGRKLPWEKPASPEEIYNIRYGQTIFATEGCASCHRLQGFESNVGFKVESEQDSSKIYAEEQWFKKLFPEVVRFRNYDEELPGSEIVNQIEKNLIQIDEKIVSTIRKETILEEIDKKYPKAIEALYSNFRYAARAKDDYYQTLIKNEKDPIKVKQYQLDHQAWKDRVHRVLMMYIQVYGLGRLIGPHLNWSGIYRSDEWLMEHFRNPSAHIPRSIMPVFPFDDTKFYALTYMLDRLAILNRQKVRDIWKLKGFDPQEAYEMHCAQCHGVGHQGYGVIAEWIYPIPKNLKNPEFLRNLTKEQVIDSIIHGIKGTPMSPWGETAKDKPGSIQNEIAQTPVLTQAEIGYLVDWIYSSLPGGEVIKETKDVPKWHYEPQDILDELRREGGQLVPLPQKEQKNLKPQEQFPAKSLSSKADSFNTDESLLSLLKSNEIYYASLQPHIYPRESTKETQQELNVADVFDIVDTQDESNPKNYYIKRIYYTPYNIQEGQKYFLLNCAVCHGNEADGSGIRGQAMQDAKPRMLTNLDWIQSRDDLRLIRSIKYGIPGTSMTPWGDYTNSLQRMQLVMFIRTLSQEREKRIQLDQTLYQTFDTAQVLVEEARIMGNQKLKELVLKEQQLSQHQKNLVKAVRENGEASEKALNMYQERLNLEQEIKTIKGKDQLLVDLKLLIKQERDLYFNLGVVLMTKDVNENILNQYHQLIRLQSNLYEWKQQRLFFQDIKGIKQKSLEIREEIEKQLDEKIIELEKKSQILKGKIASAQQKEDVATNQSDLEAFKMLKVKLVMDTEEALRLINKQNEIVEKLNDQK